MLTVPLEAAVVVAVAVQPTLVVLPHLDKGMLVLGYVVAAVVRAAWARRLRLREVQAVLGLHTQDFSSAAAAVAAKVAHLPLAEQQPMVGAMEAMEQRALLETQDAMQQLTQVVVVVVVHTQVEITTSVPVEMAERVL
jgi:hypothetical protein